MKIAEGFLPLRTAAPGHCSPVHEPVLFRPVAEGGEAAVPVLTGLSEPAQYIPLLPHPRAVEGAKFSPVHFSAPFRLWKSLL